MALSTKVAKWTQDKAGDDSTWKAYDANGNQIKNSWVQDSHGWLYLDPNGTWNKTSGNAYKDNSGKYGVVGDNGYWSSEYTPTKSLNQYQDDAAKLVEPTYQRKKTNLLNSLATGTQAYNTNYNDAVNMYADRINSQKINTEKEKSQYANNMTSRGLGHSTIVGTGIAGIGDQGSRLVNSIDIEKAQKLDDILNSIAQLKVNTQNQLNDLDSAKEDDIYAKALDLYNNDNALANDREQIKISQQNADTNKSQADAQSRLYDAEANYYNSGSKGGSGGYSGYGSSGGYSSGSTGTGTSTTKASTNNSVLGAQQLLNSAGYNAGSEDGVMGGNTSAAIKKFQYYNNLPQTGQLDSKTLALMQKGGYAKMPTSQKVTSSSQLGSNRQTASSAKELAVMNSGKSSGSVASELSGLKKILFGNGNWWNGQ